MKKTTDELFNLSPFQQKKFNELKRALNKCIKANLIFYNNYGTMGVADKAIISGYNDIPSNYPDNGENLNEIRLPCNEWADDKHYFHLTDNTDDFTLADADHAITGN